MTRDPSVPKEHHVHRTGGWLPQDHRAHHKWLYGVIEHVDQNQEQLHPVLKKFQDMIESDTRIYMLFCSMFDQVPKKHPYSNDPSGRQQVRDYQHMLHLLNHLFKTPPTWSARAEKVHVVGLPINALLDWPMGTSAGYAAFLDPKVNIMIKEVVNAWGDYLKSPASAACLGTDATDWFGDEALGMLTTVANIGQTNHKFEDIFVCEPSKQYKGYTSWDNFFTRVFKEGIRPIASPDDDSIIANACESLTYACKHGAKARDKFWVKGQPYSVLDMLAMDELAHQFVGGTVYQAFLSALSYHRWHAPVSGKIVKAYIQDGTYYSEPLYDDFVGAKGADPLGESTSQGYITATATRGIMFIQADNPKIGLMACIFVGMAEVSTCEFTVEVGQHVRKGDQLGMFHFGGSTHCLLFRKGVKVDGFPHPGGEYNIPVRSKLAEVK